MSIINEILEVSRTINHERDILTVFRHLKDEVDELEIEIDNIVFYRNSPGADGVLGEAVDVMLCAIDTTFQQNPEITEEQIVATIRRKLDKWKRVYGK